MGLGKTVQAITYLLSNLKEEETALVTAPPALFITGPVSLSNLPIR